MKRDIVSRASAATRDFLADIHAMRRDELKVGDDCAPLVRVLLAYQAEDDAAKVARMMTATARATLPPMTLPTLDRLGYAYYLRRRASTDPTWDRLTAEQQSAEVSAVRWVLDTAYGAPGDGAIYAASPGSPPPTEPAP